MIYFTMQLKLVKWIYKGGHICKEKYTLYKKSNADVTMDAKLKVKLDVKLGINTKCKQLTYKVF